MRMFIGLLLFWSSILGYIKYYSNKFKINEYLALPIIFSMIGIIMFIAGILNILNFVAILIFLGGIFSLIYYIYRSKPTKEELFNILKNPNNIIIMLIFLYITIVGINSHLTHYDNFSHWGLIVKNMFIESSLPNFDNLTIAFKGYQPGSACFIYFFSYLCGKNEVMMIIAQNYLVFSYVVVLFNYLKGNYKWLKRILLILFYIFIMSISIKFNDLLVDGLIATMTISVFAIMFNYKTEIKKAVFFSMPILIFLLLVKNTGLILAGICCLYLIYMAYRNRELKQGLKYVVMICALLFLFLLLWQKHVEFAYGIEALNSKHSLTFENILLQLREKGWSNILSWIISYVKHFLTIVNNNSNIIMLIAILLITFLLIFEKNKTEKRKQITLGISMILLYLGYFVILGVMYILSMPWNEAVIFASYDRYMSTILIIIIGCIFMYLFSYGFNKTSSKLLISIVPIILISSVLFYKDNAVALIGKDFYENSYVEKFDKALENYTVDYNKPHYIFSPLSAKDGGYMYYLAMYKLNLRATVITDLDNLDQNTNGVMIIMDDDNQIKGKMSEYGWKKDTNQIFTK